MDNFQMAITLMKKWESDEGATTEELLRLQVLLQSVSNELEEAISNRLTDS